MKDKLRDGIRWNFHEQRRGKISGHEMIENILTLIENHVKSKEGEIAEKIREQLKIDIDMVRDNLTEPSYGFWNLYAKQIINSITGEDNE